MKYRRRKLAESDDKECHSGIARQAKTDDAVFIPSKKQLNWKMEYLANQKRLLDLYEEDRLSVRGVKKKNEDEREEDRMLASACLALNIASLIGNLVASLLSGSLSVLSTFVDSAMDISCSLVMNLCLQLINHTDTFNYPRGRERLELIGVIMCSVIMGFANMGMVMQALNSMANDKVEPIMTLPTLAIIGTQTVLKGVLSWLCYRRGSTSSIIIAMDLRNDIVTRMLALICAFIGDRFWRLADPIGAIVVCALIALSWFHHAMKHIPILVGKRAEREHLSRILKIALDHDRRIKYIDHVMVYHTGQNALVEMHIVMDEHLTLKVTHDISHPLEKKLQQLDFVERAFVHCDYFCDGD